MRFLYIIIILILCISCSTNISMLPSNTILNCSTEKEEDKALKKLVEFKNRYEKTKAYFYRKCRRPTNMYKNVCLSWMNYMVLLEMEHLQIKLEYEKLKTCTIQKD